MTLLRPTLQGRKGYNPNGYGPGVNAPFGYSSGYVGKHNGQDYFWCKPETAARLGITVEQSLGVYPTKDGVVTYVWDPALGHGFWQQLNSDHRIYSWHLRAKVTGGAKTVIDRIGTMGHTGSAAGNDDHLHLEVRRAPYGFADRVDPEPWFAALSGTQRKVLPSIPVKRRLQPTTQSAEAGDPLPAGEVGNFVGWIRGELVNGNNVWFKGISGHWFWSGGFTDTGTHDLLDLNPKPWAGSSRTVRADVAAANVRALPNLSAEVTAILNAGQKVTAQGFARGVMVAQSGVSTDTWYKLDSGWAWAGSFTDSTTAGLEPLDPPAEPKVLDPSQWTGKTPDVEIAEWIGSPNFNRYPANPKKTQFTEHWMDGTLDGTDSHFQKPGTITEEGRGTGVAANFGVGQTEVHQYIKLDHYQHADGNRESNTTSVSIEHEGGPTIPITDDVYRLSALLHAQVMKTDNWDGGERLAVGVNVFPHSARVATACPGTLDLERLCSMTNAILDSWEPQPKPDPIPVPTPDPLPPVEEKVPLWFASFITIMAQTALKFLTDRK